MSSSAIKPTWAPFHSTMASEQKLLFSLRLMSGGFGDGVSSGRVLWGGWASTRRHSWCWFHPGACRWDTDVVLLGLWRDVGSHQGSLGWERRSTRSPPAPSS